MAKKRKTPSANGEHDDEAKAQFGAVEHTKKKKADSVKANVAAITNTVETDAAHVGNADEAAIAHAKGEEHQHAQSSISDGKKG